jgi:hypothetical protein
MLEDCMRVWQDASHNPALSGSDGALVSVSICVDPRRLESLLEALAQVSFPVNPQIYHDAAMVYVYADERKRTEVVTVVEFPAYAGQLSEVRRALDAFGFDGSDVQVTGMLDEIHSERALGPAPPGAAYVSRYLVKRRTASVQ